MSVEVSFLLYFGTHLYIQSSLKSKGKWFLFSHRVKKICYCFRRRSYVHNGAGTEMITPTTKRHRECILFKLFLEIHRYITLTFLYLLFQYGRWINYVYILVHTYMKWYTGKWFGWFIFHLYSRLRKIAFERPVLTFRGGRF